MLRGIPVRQIAFYNNQKTSFDTPDLWTHFFGEVALQANDRCPSFCHQIGLGFPSHFGESMSPNRYIDLDQKQILKESFCQRLLT